MSQNVSVAVIDYGAGNLRSVINALRKVGCEPIVTAKEAELRRAGAIILPGVGAAADTMHNLGRAGLVGPIKELIADGRPFFGVCIGLQVLFSFSQEGGGHHCLGVVPGQVQKLPAGQKIPHMGWNQVRQTRRHPLFEGIPDLTDFYFVHSYYAAPDNSDLVAGSTEYGIEFCSALSRGNLFGTQFHPEKSGEPGLRMYRNFLRLAADGGLE